MTALRTSVLMRSVNILLMAMCWFWLLLCKEKITPNLVIILANNSFISVKYSNKRSKNFDKMPNRRPKILRRSWRSRKRSQPRLRTRTVVDCFAAMLTPAQIFLGRCGLLSKFFTARPDTSVSYTHLTLPTNREV